MKKMLRDDLVRFFLFTILSVLATIFVAVIAKEEALSIITKGIIYIIPILSFLKNHENLKTYGVSLTLKKEAIMLVLYVIACVLMEILNSYMFTGMWYREGRIVDIFVLITETLVLSILLFISKFYRKVGFVFLLVIATITFVLISKAPQFTYLIFIFYIIIDLILVYELVVLARHAIKLEKAENKKNES